MREFEDMEYLSMGKRVRLHRLMYEHGPGNGRMIVLPIDQGLEHGPGDFVPNPESENPDFQFRLAREVGFSGIALHLGLAEKYGPAYAGQVPIVLKVNGKTRIPPEDHAFSPMTGSVEDAVRLGADAVGYTLYVGSPNQHLDINQFRVMKSEADRFGIPVFMWAYPRGEAINKKGGRDSLFAIDYAARVACELGADVVKLNIPVDDPKTRSSQPTPYDTMELSLDRMVKKVVRSAGRTKVLFSGGSRTDDDVLFDRARICMEQGAAGLIFGRNVWQRPWTEALRVAAELKRIVQST
ncbi:MAG: fructose-bisphosphate aldolase [Candidatus Thorarchaeota archaeon]|nr:fructose-bisphosphate aldolase [Candidatus Thorarchaeota archaeon]